MMLTGEHPFDTDDTPQLLKQILNGEMLVENYIDEQFDTISYDAINLVKLLTKKDPRERISAKQALDSNWIRTKLRESESLQKTQS